MITVMEIVIGLGGNLGEPQGAFRRALEALSAEGRVTAVSSLWRTRPVGPSQPEFLNAAILIEWPQGPKHLLRTCRDLEVGEGRDRAQEERWGPRVLDLDLLIAQSFVCRGPVLEIPHPQLHNRGFAVEPAAELVPKWIHPLLGRTIEDLAKEARRRDPDAIVDQCPWNLG
jgi:2-amino-4-hydroxy-6-hydroxymethyldihydropteridine diphosphokinase